MDYLIPEELKEAADIVRQGREAVPVEYVRRSRLLVKIRNSALVMALGLVIWLPIAIATHTPERFLSAMPSYLLLWAIVGVILWYVLKQTRRHAVDILDLIAEERPEMVPGFAGLMSLPWYLLIFGPWYRLGYLPRFMTRWLQRISGAFTIPK